MKMGLLLHAERGVDYAIQEAKEADRQGFDSVWLGDHIMNGGPAVHGVDGPTFPIDALTLMTAVGAVTDRVRLAFSMLNPSFRYPAMLAKSLATLDQITKGRVICSMGSGGFAREYEAYDIPFITDHDERAAHLREVVELLKELWTNPAPKTTTYEGKYVRVMDVPFNPEPFQKPHPPIWIGGESDASVAMVKGLADGWVTFTRTAARPEGISDAGPRIREVLGSPDWPTRPMTVVLQIRIFVAEDHASAVADAKQTLGSAFGGLDNVLSREIVGTPEECMEQIGAIAQSGVNYLRATFDNLEQQERASRLILGQFSEAFANA